MASVLANNAIYYIFYYQHYIWGFELEWCFFEMPLHERDAAKHLKAMDVRLASVYIENNRKVV